ncbi:MAG: SMP-30/gluconolactonase/LRE family protein [Massilia sp.]|nr:SMP-30/gluconolactonase/LRE family protein [Massilia sp.]
MHTKHTMQVAVDSKNELGECVLWCDRSARLMWTDIPAATLWVHTPATGETRGWPMLERLAAFALTGDDDRLLLGLASGLAFFSFSSGAVERICDVEPDLPGTRLNDGRCDRQGRFVFGMFNQDSDPRLPVGSFYRLNLDLTLERLPLGKVAIANSICFSPDGATMYYCDSQEKVLRCCDYGDVPGAPRVFADLSAENGEPDGSTIDADGYLWNARWGDGRLVRFAPDGSVDQVLLLAAPQPTCVAFGGARLSTVYASSARLSLSEAELAEAPASGGVFEFASAVRGLPEQRFLG